MIEELPIVNINVGILGHVDSGKTSLAKALSSVASTAAFDKSPESQRRGITLDLGFSACTISTFDFIPSLHEAGIKEVQLTFVDCPGHASLIRTILGGAQIIDIMILVIDACKGIQTQTAECLVIGEILQKPLIVVINKIDSIQGSNPTEKRLTLDKMRKRLQKTFERTRWPSVSMIEIAAAPRSEDSNPEKISQPINVKEVISSILTFFDINIIKEQLNTPLRSEDFVMMVDHCFALKGQGTVFTGTILRGQVNIGDSIIIPESNIVKKVKGIQIFRKPVQHARRGDRVGISVVQFDAEAMERGLLCSAQIKRGVTLDSTVPIFENTTVMIAEVNRIRFHQLPCDVHTKFHITIGHSTVMGVMKYFSRPTKINEKEDICKEFDMLLEGLYLEELTEDSCLNFDITNLPLKPGLPLPIKPGSLTYYAIIILERPILAAIGTRLIAARLDLERDNMCRIAIAGTVRFIFPINNSTGGFSQVPWRELPIVRFKSRTLIVERVLDQKTCIASGVVRSDLQDNNNNNNNNGTLNNKSKEKDILHAEVQKFIGLKVCFRPISEEKKDESKEFSNHNEDVIEGVIDSAFGKTGKVKIIFKYPVFSLEDDIVNSVRKKRNEVNFLKDGIVELTLKKYPLALHSQIQQ